MIRNVSTALAALVLAVPAPAQERSLDFQEGTVNVKGGIATIQLPPGYSYLQTGDARYVVEDLWDNAPDDTVIGLVVPPDLPSGEEAGWAIIVSYAADGYVSDSDAASLDFNDLLTEMQRDARAQGQALREQGYAAAELLGWAEPPHYDPTGKKLYWAQRLRFDGDTIVTLNYNVRILGRRGYLVLNAVADDGMLPTISAGSKDILAVTNFTPGNRYSDFDPSIDKVAAYGIGGLIAGKLLAKAGILKVLLKPLIILLAVLGAFCAKFLRKRDRHVVPASSLAGGGSPSGLVGGPPSRLAGNDPRRR